MRTSTQCETQKLQRAKSCSKLCKDDKYIKMFRTHRHMREENITMDLASGCSEWIHQDMNERRNFVSTVMSIQSSTNITNCLHVWRTNNGSASRNWLVGWIGESPHQTAIFLTSLRHERHTPMFKDEAPNHFLNWTHFIFLQHSITLSTSRRGGKIWACL